MIELGRLGIWSRELRFGDRAEAREAAAELEELGFGTLWIPGGGGDDELLPVVAEQLAATRSLAFATGILNVFGHDPADVAREHARLDEAFPDRFLLGIGVGHAKFLSPEAQARSQRPLEVIAGYLDELERFAPPGTAPARIVAALGPKMVALSGERTLGVHPYMVPVEHTAFVREALGSVPLVAPELSVVVGDDLAAGRDRARQDLQLYLGLPNYVTVWQRLGYGADDLADGGSDRLVDALYAYGPLERIAARIGEHRAAGADHVCLRVVTNAPMQGVERIPLDEWRTLAPLTVQARSSSSR
jgi:probable F420-dependent oxidoreductase